MPVAAGEDDALAVTEGDGDAVPEAAAFFTVTVAPLPQLVVPRNGIEPSLTITHGDTSVFPSGASLR